jgi:hypothetical protein
MMSDSECNGVEDQRGGTEREVKQIVPCTVVHQIAQACAAAICDGSPIKAKRKYLSQVAYEYEVTQDQVAERIAKTLDAIHASPCEGGMPNA